jgi:EmrB/QacA subfamily drug resistance transporter
MPGWRIEVIRTMATIALDDARTLQPQRIRVVFGGLLLAMLLAALDATIVATALPTVAGELGGLSHMSWVVTAYLLAETVGTPVWGKLGDLYGRKIILQTAILLFLAGSALCGTSQSMLQLILFRAIQGLGGGALIVTTQAVVGDIVSPRERGRYQGIFGAVFGLASVAGPLLGGYVTTHLSWRWIFYVNLPIGALALAVLAVTLPGYPQKERRTIDYLGAALLGIAVGAFVLLIDLANDARTWLSGTNLVVAATAIIALGLFLAVERRAPEPILPLHLFANRTVWVVAVVAMVVGFVLFGSVTYLPLFLQMVKGESPLASGLEMLPLMAGMPMTSILSGQLISRSGRYKFLPIAGTATATVGLLLLAGMTPHTSLVSACIFMFVLGIGLGMILQVLMIAVQNAVEYRDLGVATSSAVLFRFVGGSLGTAILGTVFAMRLESHLANLSAEAGVLHAALDPEVLRSLALPLRELVNQAVAQSLATAFSIAAGVGFLGFAIAWLLPELPLRQTIAAANQSDIGGSMAHALAMPKDADSAQEVRRGLSVLAERAVQPKGAQALIAQAGIDLSPTAACLLIRLHDNFSPPSLRDPKHHAPLQELRKQFLIEQQAGAAGSPTWILTSSGRVVIQRLVEARHARLEGACAEWTSEQCPESETALRRLARDLVTELCAEQDQSGS